MYSTSVVSHLFQEINLKLLENYLMQCSYADQLLERWEEMVWILQLANWEGKGTDTSYQLLMFLQPFSGILTSLIIGFLMSCVPWTKQSQ
jgi:hypothetical protein